MQFSHRLSGAKRTGMIGFCFLTLLGVEMGCIKKKSNNQAEIDIAWQSRRPWDQKAEDEYSAWVARFGSAREQKKCLTFSECIRNPEANSLYQAEDASFHVLADCAKAAYYLRQYFARRNNLPYSVVSRIQGASGPDGGPVKDTRTALGNQPVAWQNNMTFEDIKAGMRTIGELVCTANFRMAPEVEANDSFPIVVDRKFVRPGTMLHIPGGHVAVVYKVSDDGKVGIIDGHPDNTLTQSDSIEKFFAEEGVQWSSAARGGGFRNWRWYNYDGSGKLVYETNEQAKERGFSAEQYSASGRYEIGPRKDATYGEWVRYRLVGSTSINPLSRMTELVDNLCLESAARMDAVQIALDRKVDQGVLAALPPNVFTASGDWEAYSTPSRDIRYRNAFRTVWDHVNKSVAGVKALDSSYQYAGSAGSLVTDLTKIWSERASQCKISYKNSKGAEVALNLVSVMDRLYDLSFDPFHCVEMRWGANPSGVGRAAHAEYATCAADANKENTYWIEARLRNMLVRPVSEVTPPESGPEVAQDIHVGNLLAKLALENKPVTNVPVPAVSPTQNPPPPPVPVRPAYVACPSKWYTVQTAAATGGELYKKASIGSDVLTYFSSGTQVHEIGHINDYVFIDQPSVGYIKQENLKCNSAPKPYQPCPEQPAWCPGLTYVTNGIDPKGAAFYDAPIEGITTVLRIANGTAVHRVGLQCGFIQIDAPFIGWIRQNELLCKR